VNFGKPKPKEVHPINVLVSISFPLLAATMNQNPYLRFVQGSRTESAVFARRTPNQTFGIARQRINQLLTKTADPNHDRKACR
jgi:hypothetical protein